ncbi:DUF397 domain-containing protein [Streptomyces pratensis]
MARNIPRAVALRDSKRSDEHLLVLAPAARGGFIAGLRRQS